MDAERFERQIRFLVEVDRLKSVLRRTRLTDDSRRENSAEHSWHVALMAVLLAEYGPPELDSTAVITMLLLHDLVEIDAGDTFAYDAAGLADREERERRAAKRIFGLLPSDQAASLRARWEEFEAGESEEACFAIAMDRLQPLLQNVFAQGGAWRSHGVTREQVLARMQPIERLSPGIWAYVVRLIDEVWANGIVRAPGG